MRDYYEVLGVKRSAGSRELKSAYRKLARRWHPDLHPELADGAERFREISEAYRILSDPESRTLYDNRGHCALRGRLRGMDLRSHRRFYDGFFSKTTRLSSLYQALHSYGRERRKGYDIRLELPAEIWKQKRDGKVRVRLKRRRYCARCRGKKKIGGKACRECHGIGRKSYPSTVLVLLPARAKEGDVLHLAGKGHAGFKGAPPGDLYLILR